MTKEAVIRHVLQIAFLTFILGASLTLRAEKDYAVIIHPTVSDKILSVNTLGAIFGMRMQTWSDGTRIRVYVLPDDSPLHQRFSKGILNVFPYQLRAAWDRLVFSGIGQAPIKVASHEEMLAKVASTPGAIGYMWRASIDDSVDVIQVKK